MTNLSELSKAYITSDADAVAADIADRKIAYGADGKIIGTLGAITFDQVKLLLHMNGVDASTTFTDDSDSAHVVTPSGDAQIDTADSKFGGASGLFDGTGDYLTIPYVANEFDWYAADYTLEAWVKAAAWTGWGDGLKKSALIGRMNPTTVNNYWSFGPDPDGKLSFNYYNGSAIFLTGTTALPTNQWVHIAMTHVLSTGEMKTFIDGEIEVSTTKAGTPQSATDSLIIGKHNNTAITGWVDDLRIIRGTAKYTANFTPPTQQHPDS